MIRKMVLSHGILISSEKNHNFTWACAIAEDVFGDISCVSTWTFSFEKHKGYSQQYFHQASQVPFEN